MTSFGLGPAVAKNHSGVQRVALTSWRDGLPAKPCWAQAEPVPCAEWEVQEQQNVGVQGPWTCRQVILGLDNTQKAKEHLVADTGTISP